MKEVPKVPQVVTEHDMYLAMFHHMAAQIDGRFRLQFPEQKEFLDGMLYNFKDPQIRGTLDGMKRIVNNTISMFGMTLTMCKLDGCLQENNHAFLREFINMVWDAREQTSEWLKANGSVPGTSYN